MQICGECDEPVEGDFGTLVCVGHGAVLFSSLGYIG